MLIFELLKSGNTDQLFLELEKHYIDTKDKQGNTILHLAVANKNLPLAKILIDKYHANVNAQNDFNHTPLLTATLHKDLEMIRMLLQRNASTKLTTDIGLTPIQLAIEQSNLPAVLLLYEVDHFFGKPPFGGTPLHGVADSLNDNGYNEELVSFLLDVIPEKDLQQEKDNLGRTVYDAFSDKGDYYFERFKSTVADNNLKKMSSNKTPETITYANTNKKRKGRENRLYMSDHGNKDHDTKKRKSVIKFVMV
jgi:hypothetical protein